MCKNSQEIEEVNESPKKVITKLLMDPKKLPDTKRFDFFASSAATGFQSSLP